MTKNNWNAPEIPHHWEINTLQWISQKGIQSVSDATYFHPCTSIGANRLV